ncbi:NAD(P)/FAD-dependent oxidoreductase [Hymenobacter properus]|uniref:NAD(P)/FAD-dependent oxidoreductase n=1 Tax=Hymenobacter properus TaxID=2791026 RepID=A0A931BB66_9BACT|nr:NAD(P)/FAD-dependent oxidoreductase [Hymenobacter properus]MBF9140544.1 NAD(P)/FAD-dependent oxidoreductase [Hymenobacter properus]MBR7719351.1 NAD(P)/FAD-dependent oxidoreductase [Microvirga sp. SRT04]
MQEFDILIIGGSYAGLSAAMALGRARRRVLILDTGRPCNRQTPHSHNFLTQDGATPAALRARAIEQVLQYPTIELRADEALTAASVEGGFRIETAAGTSIKARKVVLATGITDMLPALPGFAECWGISVLHCPYCHGYEVADQRLGVLGNGDVGFEFARLIRQWSAQLTLFTDGPATLTESQRATLARHLVGVVETPIRGLAHDQGQLRAVQLADGSSYPLDGVFARVPFALPGTLAQQLGCAITEMGYVQVDDFQRTSVAGVYAAGDNTTPMRAVAAAVAAGSKAGAVLNKELIDESFT